ncbi:MAG: type VI secretion system baseplate subunit TssK [Desulfobacteraceae bacterium]
MTKPIFWHQGLFLQQHHFQLCDLHTKSLFNFLYKYVHPHLWGIVSLDIVESSLSDYTFEIKSGNILFKDTTHCILGENAIIKPRSFENAWKSDGKTFNVYLGLKKWKDDSENVTVVNNLNELTHESSRLVSLSDPEEVPDMYYKGPKAEIKTMSYHIEIFWETELDQMGDYLLIPVAQLIKKSDEISLSKKFIMPCVSISSSDILYDIIKEIKNQIISRCRQLESIKRDKNIHSSDFGSRDMIFMLVLRSLNRYVPLLNHYSEIQYIHPWTIYGILRQIVGELSSFSRNFSVKGESIDGYLLLPEYNHKELYHCFDTIQKIITTLLKELTAGPDYIIPLNYDGTYFAAELAPKIFDDHNRFFLVVVSEEPSDMIISSFQSIAKISSREEMPLIIAKSLSGVKTTHLSALPQELPSKTDTVYFQIDHHSKQWIAVKEKKNIALYWDTAPADIKVEMIVIKRS